MRPLGMIGLLVVCAAAHGQADDPRFAKRVTFDEPYLPLQALAARVSQETGVKVECERAISERKVGIFVDDEPVGRVMARVASTMFVQWVPAGDGFRLQLDPDVAKEERIMAAEEDRSVREGLQRGLADSLGHARQSLQAFRDGYTRGQAEYTELLRDRTPDGIKKSRAFALDFYRRYPQQGQREAWDRGRVLAQMNTSQLGALLNGTPFFASSAPIPGAIPMPKDSTELLDEGGLRSSMGVKDLLLIGWMDPAERKLNFRYRTLGGDGAMSTTHSVAPLDDAEILSRLGQLELAKRLTAFSEVKDAEVLNRRLDREAPRPKDHETGLWTQAQALQWLHRLSGLPVVCDSFRTHSGYAEYDFRGSVEEFLKKLTVMPQYSSAYWLPPYVRTDTGWVMVRHRRYWRWLRSEVPEGRIKAMEARGTPSVNDYADFVGGMTMEQARRCTEPTTFMVDFPTFALNSDCLHALRFWSTLPNSLRQNATRGIRLGLIQGSSRRALLEWQMRWALEGFPAEKWIPAVVAGEGLPDDAIFKFRLRGPEDSLLAYGRRRIARPMESYSSSPSPFIGASFSIAVESEELIGASVPISPLPGRG